MEIDMPVILAMPVTVEHLLSHTGCNVGPHSTKITHVTLIQHISVELWVEQTEKKYTNEIKNVDIDDSIIKHHSNLANEKNQGWR
jgi:hypothetical protein